MFATKTVKQALIEARKLIENPDTWGKGYYCRDGKYCFLGSIYSIPDKSINTIDYIYRFNEKRSIVDFNDNPNTTHADVLAFLDRAIEECKE